LLARSSLLEVGSDGRGCPLPPPTPNPPPSHPPCFPLSRWQGHENKGIADRSRRRASPFPPSDTLVALLNFFLLTSDTCLDLTMLSATDTSRLGWLSPFTVGIQLISPPPTHNPSQCTCGISMAGALILQLRDTMSLRTADLGSWCGRVRSFWISSTTPAEPPTIPSTRASALQS